MSNSIENFSQDSKEPVKVESFGNPEFERFASDIGGMIDQIEGEKLVKLMDSRFDGVSGRTGKIEGQVGDSEFSITLPPTDPNMGFVGFAELRRGEESFEVVIKSKADEMRGTTKDYLELTAQKPVVKELTPELYGMYGDWAVIEKMEGVESEELQGLLENDLEFRKRYVEKSFGVMQTTAKEKLDLRDVAFSDGHNVMADPTSGEITLMEPNNVAVDRESMETRELIAVQLFSEVGKVARPEVESFKQEYAYDLTRRVLEEYDEKDLYIQPRGYSVDHPKFIERYNYYHLIEPGGRGDEMTEEKRQQIANNPEASKSFMAPAGSDPGYHARVLHPDLLEAAKKGNRDDFIKHLNDRKSVHRIRDSDDLRTERVFLD